MSGMGRGTLGEVRDGSGDPRGCSGRVWTIPAARDGSGDPQGGPGRVGGISMRSGTGWGTLSEARDRSGNFVEVCNGPRDSRGGPVRVEQPSGIFGTGQGTLEGVLGQVGGTSLRSGTGRRTLQEVRNTLG